MTHAQECGKNVDAPGLAETVGDRLRQSRKARDHRQAQLPMGLCRDVPVSGVAAGSYADPAVDFRDGEQLRDSWAPVDEGSRGSGGSELACCCRTELRMQLAQVDERLGQVVVPT